MDTFPDEFLLDILVHLPLTDKVSATRVCHAWKRVCRELIRRQNKLELTRVDPGSVFEGRHVKHSNCVDGKANHTTGPEDLIIIRGEEHMMRIITCLHLYCPKISIMSVSGVQWHRCRDQLRVLINFILTTYGTQLVCLSLCDFHFNYRVALPVLQHLSITGITIEGMQFLLANSKSLTSLQVYEMDRSIFSDLPKGLKTFKMMSDQNHLENVFVSPAAETLEVVSLRSHDGLDTATFTLPKLKSIYFSGRLTGTVLRDFLRSLELSSGLLELELYSVMGGGEELSHQDCIRFFSAVPLLQRLRVGRPSIPGQIVQVIVNSCPELKMISFTDGILSDDALGHLGRLTNLQDLEIVFNQGIISDLGISLILNGRSQRKLRRLIVFKSRGNFVTDEIKERLLFMKNNDEYQLKEVKLSCDSGSIRF